jgi:phage terminase small subunit
VVQPALRRAPDPVRRIGGRVDHGFSNRLMCGRLSSRPFLLRGEYVARELTPKQKRFVEEYLVDLNATAAAGRAGYKDANKGRQLVTKSNVAAAIAAQQATRATRVNVKQDYVISNLTEVVERCMQRAPVMVRHGKEWIQATDEGGRDVWRFDAKGATSALNLLGLHLGLWKMKHEHSGRDGKPIEFIEVCAAAGSGDRPA